MTIPEYEYLDDTPTTGGWPVLLKHLGFEIEYLAHSMCGGSCDEPEHQAAHLLNAGVIVHTDHWGAGTVRSLRHA